jgi:hypothetical protein
MLGNGITERFRRAARLHGTLAPMRGIITMGGWRHCSAVSVASGREQKGDGKIPGSPSRIGRFAGGAWAANGWRGDDRGRYRFV